MSIILSTYNILFLPPYRSSSANCVKNNAIEYLFLLEQMFYVPVEVNLHNMFFHWKLLLWRSFILWQYKYCSFSANATCPSIRCPYFMECLVHPVTKQPICTNCRPQCSPLSVVPVCGTDGISYKNYCTLRKKSCEMRVLIQTKYSGRCHSKSNLFLQWICMSKECLIISHKTITVSHVF